MEEASKVDLLQLWRTVSQEAAGLAEAVEQLPDACECGDAEAHREVFLAACDLHRIVECFARAIQAVAGFRRACTVSRMQAVKRACAGLREHCERVDAELGRALD